MFFPVLFVAFSSNLQSLLPMSMLQNCEACFLFPVCCLILLCHKCSESSKCPIDGSVEGAVYCEDGFCLCVLFLDSVFSCIYELTCNSLI